MRQRRFLLVALLGVLGVFLTSSLGLFACQSPSLPLGSPCSSDTDCFPGLFCDQGTPGGLCTMVCSSSIRCPSPALCVSIEARNDLGEPLLLRRCLLPCLASHDCRPNEACLPIPKNTSNVCFPF